MLGGDKLVESIHAAFKTSYGDSFQVPKSEIKRQVLALASRSRGGQTNNITHMAENDSEQQSSDVLNTASGVEPSTNAQLFGRARWQVKRELLPNEVSFCLK